jgi:hypothetical protein
VSVFLATYALPVVVACALALLGLRWAWLHARARRFATGEATRALTLMGPPTSPADARRGAEVTFEGTLVVSGACPAPSDGRDAAVVSGALASKRFVRPAEPLFSYRAEEVLLRAGDRTIPLEGPIELRAGGRSWWPCARDLPPQARSRLPSDLTASMSNAVVRSAQAGDLVRVTGMLADGAAEPSTYREGWSGIGLCGDGDKPIVMVGLAPRVSIARRMLFSSPVVAAAVALLAVAGLYLHLSLPQCDRCEEAGLCTVVSDDDLPPRFRCAAASDADCARSAQCRRDGACSSKGDGTCAPGSDGDCARSSVCLEQARCSHLRPSYDGPDGCTLRGPADCQQSRWCKEEGRCRYFRYQCVADPAAVCRADSRCTDYGDCAFRDDMCVVARDEDCARSTYCRLHGDCAMVEIGSTTSCKPRREEHCLRSEGCRSDNHCILDDDLCAVGDCKELCKSEGRCTPVKEYPHSKGECRALRDADCTAAAACKKEKRCQAAQGRCIVPGSATAAPQAACDKTQECLQSGHCASRDGQCVVSEAGCRDSLGCKQLGLCSVVDGRCRAKSDADCQAAEICEMQKRCSAHEGDCTLAPADP